MNYYVEIGSSPGRHLMVSDGSGHVRIVADAERFKFNGTVGELVSRLRSSENDPSEVQSLRNEVSRLLKVNTELRERNNGLCEDNNRLCNENAAACRRIRKLQEYCIAKVRHIDADLYCLEQELTR